MPDRSSPAPPHLPVRRPTPFGTGGDGQHTPPPSWQPLTVLDAEPEAPTPVAARPDEARLLPVPAAPPPLFPEAPSPLEAKWAFYDRLDMLRRGRGLILGIAGAVFALVALYTLFGPRSYEAYSLLLIDGTRPDGDAAAAFMDVPGLEERRLFNQALILQQSPEIAERTVERLRADEVPLPLDVAEPEALARYLQEKVVAVEPAGEEVDVVRITASAPDAATAARIAEVYTEEYVARTRETSRLAITATRHFLESQLQQRQAELEAVEAEITTYTTGTGAVALDQQAAASIAQVAQLEAALDRARIEQQTRQAALESLEREMRELEPGLQRRLASGVEGRLTQVNTRIAELETITAQIYQRTPALRADPSQHPQLTAMTAELQTLQAERDRLSRQLVDEVMEAGGVDLSGQGQGGAYVAELRRRIGEERVALSGAEAEIVALQQRLGGARGALTAIPAQATELAQLRRRQQAIEQTVGYLQQRAEQARIAEETEFGLAQVIRSAQVPESPAGLPVPIRLGIGLLLGLFAGLGAAAVRHRFDGTLYAPRDLDRLGYHVIGAVPPLAAEQGLAALTHPFSAEAEAFRHLHANLRLGPGGPRPQAVVVTSPEAGTGKTTVALNLAVAAAHAGRRTLVIDADLRRPAVKAMLGLDDQQEVGGSTNRSHLAYWTTPVENLFALTVREPARHPNALWGAEQVRELLVHLRGAFDLIVFDAPAALVAADAAVLASQADAVLLVAAAGATDASALLQATAELQSAGGEILGAVLNRFDPRRAAGYARTYEYRYTHAPATA